MDEMELVSVLCPWITDSRSETRCHSGNNGWVAIPFEGPAVAFGEQMRLCLHDAFKRRLEFISRSD